MREMAKVVKWAENAPLDQLVCRVWLHGWPLLCESTETRGHELHTKKSCTRCGAVKVRVIDRDTGEYIRSYFPEYPDGYLIKGNGQLLRPERGVIALELNRRGG